VASSNILIAAVKNAEAALVMSRTRGFRRDYRGVKLFAYDFPLEEDLQLPWVQVDLGDAAEYQPPANDRLWWTQQLIVQVHLVADRLSDNSLDIVTPMLDAKADIHQALYADRTRGTGYCTTFYRASDVTATWGIGDEVVGATLRETYEIVYWFISGDMGTAPS
jgi:hypothetical protein